MHSYKCCTNQGRRQAEATSTLRPRSASNSPTRRRLLLEEFAMSRLDSAPVILSQGSLQLPRGVLLLVPLSLKRLVSYVLHVPRRTTPRNSSGYPKRTFRNQTGSFRGKHRLGCLPPSRDNQTEVRSLAQRLSRSDS